jgi:hypothetical protein
MFVLVCVDNVVVCCVLCVMVNWSYGFNLKHLSLHVDFSAFKTTVSYLTIFRPKKSKSQTTHQNNKKAKFTWYTAIKGYCLERVNKR